MHFLCIFSNSCTLSFVEHSKRQPAILSQPVICHLIPSFDHRSLGRSASASFGHSPFIYLCGRSVALSSFIRNRSTVRLAGMKEDLRCLRLSCKAQGELKCIRFRIFRRVEIVAVVLFLSCKFHFFIFVFAATSLLSSLVSPSRLVERSRRQPFSLPLPTPFSCSSYSEPEPQSISITRRALSDENSACSARGEAQGHSETPPNLTVRVLPSVRATLSHSVHPSVRTTRSIFSSLVSAPHFIVCMPAVDRPKLKYRGLSTYLSRSRVGIRDLEAGFLYPPIELFWPSICSDRESHITVVSSSLSFLEASGA